MSKVLVVEDEPAIARIIADNLEFEGYEVERVGDGPQGLERALSDSADLILLDIMLPGGINGYDICRRMREAGINTPVIMLTAKSEEVDKVLAWSWGPTTTSRNRLVCASCWSGSKLYFGGMRAPPHGSTMQTSTFLSSAKHWLTLAASRPRSGERQFTCPQRDMASLGSCGKVEAKPFLAARFSRKFGATTSIRRRER